MGHEDSLNSAIALEEVIGNLHRNVMDLIHPARAEPNVARRRLCDNVEQDTTGAAASSSILARVNPGEVFSDDDRQTDGPHMRVLRHVNLVQVELQKNMVRILWNVASQGILPLAGVGFVVTSQEIREAGIVDDSSI